MSPNGFLPTLSELSEKQQEKKKWERKKEKVIIMAAFLAAYSSKIPSGSNPKSPFQFSVREKDIH